MRIACLVLASLMATGCASSTQRASEIEKQETASKFARALFQSRDLKLATSYASRIPTQVSHHMQQVRRYRLRMNGRVTAGCEESEMAPLPSGFDCFSVKVKGGFVPDPKNLSWGSVAFGAYSFAVTDDRSPTVVGISFVGGGTYRECQGAECDIQTGNNGVTSSG